MIAIIQVICGLVFLLAGAELLVRGASRLATSFGMSPLAIGLTVVAFGTSSPELAVSLNAAWTDQYDVVIGNAVGSNIFNILIILGLSSMIIPLAVHQQIIRIDLPIMVGISSLVWWMLADGFLSRIESAILVFGAVMYTLLTLRLSKNESESVKIEYAQAFEMPRTTPRRGRSVLLIVFGLAMCVLGSRWMVAGAITIAKFAGLSELLIGLTIVAAGTSLPELATSAVAAIRGQRDIAVGNVIGSNIFNLLGILGLTGLIGPSLIPASSQVLQLHLPVMVGVSVVCLPVLLTDYVISRWEGVLFVVFYVSYVMYMVLLNQQHSFAIPLGNFLIWGMLPIALLAVVWSIMIALRKSRKCNI
ncbi:MAG TPA: sodium:calcium antiporter [Phycisphaerales bacterium]|nr:sodium:calcium antiporter [Phycisphaerales bacterium]HCD32831.1 sodium:calcium antiporter [Phycisphaerales bacterium]|tara:strand:+ start:499 stop:1581 length:1083 start_codon:yes stop_codon:yes gene_type:complete